MSAKPGRVAGPIAITFTARTGGVPRTQVTLANALVEQGIRSALVLPRVRNTTVTGLSAAVDVVDLKALGVVRFAMRFATYLRRASPVAVLASEHLTGLSVSLAAALARYDGPVVLTIHNDPSHAVYRGRFQRLMKLVIRLSHRRVDAFVAVSSGVAEDLALLFPNLGNRLRVIYNAVPFESTRDLAQRALDPRDPWVNSEGGPLFVAVGRLVPQKDFATLIRAVALCRFRTSCRMLILGEGVERPSLEKLIDDLRLHDSVRLLGHQSNPYRIMSRADALVSSSRWEGFGQVLLEALALGLPIISTDCRSGPAEVLDHGRYGVLVPVGDEEALAAAMIQVASGDRQGDKVSRERRAAEFSPKRAADSYLEVLRDVRGGSFPLER